MWCPARLGKRAENHKKKKIQKDTGALHKKKGARSIFDTGALHKKKGARSNEPIINKIERKLNDNNDNDKSDDNFYTGDDDDNFYILDCLEKWLCCCDDRTGQCCR